MKPVKHIDRFIEQLRQMNGVEIAGVARMLNVKMMEDAPEGATKEEKLTPRPTVEIIEDLIKGFMNHPRKGRRRLLKIMEDANAAKKLNRGTRKDSPAIEDTTSKDAESDEK